MKQKVNKMYSAYLQLLCVHHRLVNINVMTNMNVSIYSLLKEQQTAFRPHTNHMPWETSLPLGGSFLLLLRKAFKCTMTVTIQI